jgi:hypothetical protein
MKAKSQKLVTLLRITAIYLAFFAILIARNAKALGLPPLISVPPLGITVQSGGTATLTATIGLSLTPLEITWRLNGTNIPNPKVSNLTVPILGTTLSTLTITNATAANAGNYSVHVENGGGEINSGNGLLVVLPLNTILQPVTSLLSGGCGMTNGGFRLQLIKPATSNCVIEATSDCKTWTPIYTNSGASTNFSFLDSAATNMTLRYYRARLQ